MKKIFTILLVFALCGFGCQKKEAPFANRWYTYEDVQRYIQIGTTEEVVLSHFGKPVSESVDPEGRVFWSYPILGPKPKGAKTAGVSLVLKDGKVIYMSPILYSVHR